MIRRILVLLANFLMVTSALRCMIYDNRFWPLYPERFLSYQAHPCSGWYAGARGIFLGADEAYLKDEEEATTLFAPYGTYDEVIIDRALQRAGITTGSLLSPTEQQLSSVIWSVPGKMSLRGCAIETEVYLFEAMSIGGSCFVGNMLSHANATLLPESAYGGPGDRISLIDANTRMLALLGLTDPCFSSVVFGDIDLYCKGRVTADYWYTIHHLDVSGRFGLYIPSGTRRQLYSPVSFPVGGDGRLGVYGQLDGMFRLKELLTVGFSLQLSKRLARTLMERVPLLTEPTNYGALVVPVRTDPGMTIAFNPYIQVGGIRGGLGLFGGYYLVYHAQDRVTVSSEVWNTYHPNLTLVEERSVWGSDHFSAAVWYDFGYESDSSWSKPLISLTLDIPWKGAVTQLVPKSHAISLRIEFEL